MKRIVGLWVHLLGACIPVFSQVDTSYVYNTAMSYGTLDIRIAKSPTRYYYLQEDVTFSFRESAPGVKTNTYRDMTSWDSSPYKQGNLREKNGTANAFVMNYRLLPPLNYNPSFAEGYPIIIMIHGAGESANCWDNDCNWDTPNWNPNTNSPPAPTTANHPLLNNDINLLHGGAQHLAAVKAAGSMLPDNPSLPAKAFPGFVLFPQSLNGWSQSSKVEDAIRLLRLLMKKYNINPNRVYIHGLSNGGGGVYQAIKRAPWLFTAALPMSAINDGGIPHDGMTPEVSKLPLWVFQGGQDKNPTPSKTFNTVRAFRDAGASIRYYLYPNLGHGTWNTAYNEPDFFSWMLAKRKTNPHVVYGNPVICNTTGAGVRLQFSKGFLAYQWEHDGQIISGEINAEYVANTPGTYRGRFSRKSTSPGEAQWEKWSDPVVVSETNPAKPVVQVTGTTHLRGPGLISNETNNTVILKAKGEADLYNWYKNGTLINFPVTDIDDTLRTAKFISSSNNSNGTYTLVIKNSYCPSPPSDPVQLFFNNSAPQNITLNAAAADLKGIAMSSSISMQWNDVLNNETGYELWRRKLGTADFVFVVKTSKDAISYNDTGLEPSTTYEYKLRAINDSGRSNYAPSDNINTNYKITTTGDPVPPHAPQDLKIVSNTLNTITFSWKGAEDNTGIRQYYVYYNNSSVATGSAGTTYTLAGLTPNSVYSVYIKAVDLGGNFSPASNQVNANTYVLALSYKHSTGAFLNLRDTAITPTWNHPEFTGTVKNFTLAPRTQEDFFNFEFRGYLFINTEGDYTFSVTSDDGSMFMLDGDTIINNDGRHGNITKISEVLHLAAGPHPLQLPYFEYNGGQTLIVKYKGPGIGDGNTFTVIPDPALVSGNYTPPAPPSAPTNLTAQGVSMKQINLSWNYVDNDQTDFEVQRASSSDGIFTMMGRIGGLTFQDTVSLVAGRTYYYKVRTVTNTGVSPFTAIVSASTTADQQAPSVPTALQLQIKNHSSAVFSWTVSTDNIGVAGYEVYVDGVLKGTTTDHVYTLSDLAPNTAYSITLKAFDASGNHSTFSDALIINTTPSAAFYSTATGSLNALTTWKQNADGTGTSPASFADDGQYFIINNRTSVPLGGAWEVTGASSKVVVPTGVTLTVDNNLNAVVELQGTATLNLNYATMPRLINISSASTVNFNTYSVVPNNTYGNISLSGPGIKAFDADVIQVKGNLTVKNGITLKGAPDNATKVLISGNLSIAGVPGETSADNSIDLQFVDNGTHTLSSGGDLCFYAIALNSNAALNIVNAGQPIKLKLGSSNGGGLALANGSAMNIGSNKLKLVEAAQINPDNQTGRIGVSGGDIFITTSSNLNSNLYFDGASQEVDSLYLDLRGSGNTFIRSPLKISGAIKLKNGILNAGGSVTLLSTALKNATIAEIENSGIITGDVTVQHYLGTSGWWNLSSSVEGVTVADWQNYFPVTGQFTGASSGTTDPSMFVSNGTALTPYPATGGSNQAPIERSKGYYTKVLNQPVTLQETGNPYQGNVSFTLQGGSGAGANNGWNLVGNPYASPVLWGDNADTWTSAGISNVIALQENKVINGQPVSQFKYYTPLLGKAVINPGQAFWVQAFNTTPSLSINEKAKTPDAVVYPQPVPSLNYLIITLQQGMLADQAYVMFTAEGADSFDNLYDALKRQNEGVFNLSTVLGESINVAVNTMSTSFCSKAIKLNLQNTVPGSYSFAFSGLETVTALGKVTLKDNFTGTTTELTSAPYAFSITAEPASFGSDRFVLNIERMLLDVASPQVTASPACAQGDALVTIVHSQPGVQYEALNASDQIISNAVEGGAPSISLELSKEQLSNGINHIRVRAGFNGCATHLLTSETDISYTSPFTIDVQDDVTVCRGDAAVLNASGVPSGGHYRWQDEHGTEITSTQSGVLHTAAILEETVFQVAGVMANGCESEKKNIHVYADTLDKPVISAHKDTLFVRVSGSYQWKKEGQIIDGATSAFLKVVESGTYSVIASKGNCSLESEPFVYVSADCVVDTVRPTATAQGNCGADAITIFISEGETGVRYTAINMEDKEISAPATGKGSAISLQLSSEALSVGPNEIRIRANFPGCGNYLLESKVLFVYSGAIAIQTLDTVRTCKGSTALLNASGAPADGHYLWYDSAGNVIDGAQGPSYVTGPVVKEIIYYVSAVYTTGCESARKLIHVFPGLFPVPVITLKDGLLTASGTGAFQWKRNGEIITDANRPSISPQLSGSYSVIVSQGNCSQESEPFNFTVTALANGYSGEFVLNAYPVPATIANLTISVQSPKAERIFIEMIDTKGVSVFKNSYALSELTAGVPITPGQGSLAEGIYFVIATQGDVQVRRRVVVRN
jgi:hypothetical protein